MTSEVQSQADALELAMRSILKLFADGRLTYRYREQRARLDVDRASRRVRELRGERDP